MSISIKYRLSFDSTAVLHLSNTVLCKLCVFGVICFFRYVLTEVAFAWVCQVALCVSVCFRVFLCACVFMFLRFFSQALRYTCSPSCQCLNVSVNNGPANAVGRPSPLCSASPSLSPSLSPFLSALKLFLPPPFFCPV